VHVGAEHVCEEYIIISRKLPLNILRTSEAPPASAINLTTHIRVRRIELKQLFLSEAM
jgi:hypothetical protein